MTEALLTEQTPVPPTPEYAASIIYLSVVIEFCKSCIRETNREPIMTRRIAIAAMLILVLGNQACTAGSKNADQVVYQPAACGVPSRADAGRAPHRS